jgi:hypothetical protein
LTTASAHQFFAASASVGGALIGLLFVAVSVARERLGDDPSPVHSVRAAATLTAFTNALTVVLVGLVPGFNVGDGATAVAIVGLLFITGALLRVGRGWRANEIRLRDISFLVGLFVVFVIQLIAGITLTNHANDSGQLQTICVLVIVCFLIGIERAWELVGGPRVGLGHELVARAKERRDSPNDGP